MTNTNLITFVPALNTLAKSIRFTSASKGFEAPNKDNIHNKLLLAISEICEAQEELRDGHGITEIYFPDKLKEMDNEVTMAKPEGFPVEIADAIIRLLDIAGSLDIDIASVIDMKIRYNMTRPEKHGRIF